MFNILHSFRQRAQRNRLHGGEPPLKASPASAARAGGLSKAAVSFEARYPYAGRNECSIERARLNIVTVHILGVIFRLVRCGTGAPSVLPHPTRRVSDIERKHMIVRVFARRDPDRKLVAARDIIGEADVIEVVHFNHQVIDALVGTADPERDRMIALIAMHKYGRRRMRSHPELVFNAAAHSQSSIEAKRGIDVAFADNAMAHATVAGLEASVHSASRIKRFRE